MNTLNSLNTPNTTDTLTQSPQSSNLGNLSNLAIWGYRITKSGKIRVTEYIDLSTGEIIQKENTASREIRPDAMLERQRRLDSLREEVRAFAVFVLHFRNEACGFLVPMDTIKSWYSKYSGKRTDNINRYIQKLIEAGILENEIQLTKVFMLNNPNRSKKDALGDVFRAESKFSILMLGKENHEIP